MYKVKKAKQALTAGIRGYLLKDESGSYLFDKTQRLPIYLEGAPGIGKTQIAQQVAEELGIGFVSFSITHHTRNSLLGLPVIKDVAQGKYTEYTMSEILAKVYEEKAKGYEEGILLLDEFACVSETLMPTMLAFLQTKNIGMYTLPEGWTIVLCGNPPQYNRSARRFDAAILDRMRRIEMEYTYADFIEYAKAKHFHEVILSYLDKNRQDVYYCRQEKGELEIVTCRSWENLSNALYANESLGEKVDLEFIRQFVKYNPVAVKFSQYYEVMQSGVTEEDITAILSGEKLDYYRQKWEKKPVRYWLNILDMLKKSIESSGGREKNDGLLSRQISNVFRLFSGVKWERSLKEKMYLAVNDSPLLLSAMAKQRNEEYLDICKVMYGI